MHRRRSTILALLAVGKRVSQAPGPTVMAEVTKVVRDKWIGFDLGGTKMLCAVCDAKFEPLARKRRKTKGNEALSRGVDRITETSGKVLEESGHRQASTRGNRRGLPRRDRPR